MRSCPCQRQYSWRRRVALLEFPKPRATGLLERTPFPAPWLRRAVLSAYRRPDFCEFWGSKPQKTAALPQTETWAVAVDARFPVRYINDRRVMRLTPDQFRIFVLATAWSVTNRTDGEIEAADMPFIPFASERDAKALVGAGLWAATKKGWVILDFGTTQTSSAQLERLEETRRRDRDRKARERKAKPDNPPEVRPKVRPEVQPEVQPDSRAEVCAENQGKARTGKARQGSGQKGLADQDFWESGFPICGAEGCSAQLLHESQQESGRCYQHYGQHLRDE